MGALFHSASQMSNPIVSSVALVARLNPSCISLVWQDGDPGFLLSPRPCQGYPGFPTGFAPLFLDFPEPPQVQSMGPAGAVPLLMDGSARPVISLPSLQPRSSVSNPSPPSLSAGSSHLPLGTL